MKKTIFTIITTLILALSFIFPAFAAGGNEDDFQLLVISHRGGPDVSVEYVESDFQNGADMVSVSVLRTESGEFLLENSAWSSRITSLPEVIAVVPDGKCIVIDGAWEFRDEIEKLADSQNASEKVVLRTEESTKDLQRESLSLRTISVYSGGIVFSAEQRIKYAKPSNFIQFQSKNYFNPFYQFVFTKHFTVPIIAPMYDKDLCGQRTDGVVGWDEMIERGYSGIETTNVEGLVNYREQMNAQRSSLEKYKTECETFVSRQGKMYSSASIKKLSDLITKAEKKLGKLSSLGELQTCEAEMKNAMEKLSPSEGRDTTLGAWNITPGKIIASVLCAAGLIGFEVFLIKKRKKKGENK